jgi:anti-sigma factor (TIGR02949 family)
VRLFRRRVMGCMEVGRLLQQYLDGDLDAGRAHRLEAHLEDCRRCGMEAETYTQIKASLERHRREAVPRDALDRLRAFGERLAQGVEPEMP